MKFLAICNGKTIKLDKFVDVIQYYMSINTKSNSI